MRLSKGTAAATIAFGLVACGGGTRDGRTSDTPAEAGAETTVAVEMGDFFVDAVPASVPAGTVTFQITPEPNPIVPHALTVLRTDLPPDELPTTPDGNADTIAEGIEIIYSEAGTGEYHTAKVELRPGSYALICNIGNHYSQGMHTGFEVQ